MGMWPIHFKAFRGIRAGRNFSNAIVCMHAMNVFDAGEAEPPARNPAESSAREIGYTASQLVNRIFVNIDAQQHLSITCIRI